jgi:hypothetical protein
VIDHAHRIGFCVANADAGAADQTIVNSLRISFMR